MFSQLRSQASSKNLEQHLKTHFGDSRVIAVFTQLVPDESVLRARDLVETKLHAGRVQGVADQISACSGHVVVVFAKDQHELGFDVGGAAQGVVLFAAREGVAVDVGWEVTYCGGDAGVEGAAVGEVAAETHACCADAAGAGGQGEEGVDCQGGVFVVGGEGFLDFPRVACVGAGDVVGERLVRGEFVVR